MNIYELETKRLLLRKWLEHDRVAFRELNANKNVMKYFPDILSYKESDAMFEKIREKFDRYKWGLWALEIKETREFIGFTGLNIPTADLSFSPCVEVGWRLNEIHWGKGYATEAATECLNFAFNTLCIEEVVSFTSILNKPSQAVMKRLKMRKEEEHFFHPSIAKGHSLSEHVLYRISNRDFEIKT